MSIISVTVDEQNLHITDSPKIAAQGVNENYIEFTFDSTWTGFAKVALFYREEDEDTVYQSIIDENSLALIPHEVTDQDGKICFGVAGVKDDKIFTTEILTYKIVKGLYVSGEGTTPPTPGIYEQMLALAQQIVNNESDFEDEITARVDNLVAHYNVEYGSVELWSGSASGAETTGNLSQAADAFDYLDIYVSCNGVTHIKTVKPVFNEATPPFVPQFDVDIAITEADGGGLIVGQMRLRFTKANNASGFVIIRQGFLNWTGDAADSAEWVDTANFAITKIVGRKIYENAEVADIRVGADGTVYNSAGTAVRAQIEAAGGGGGGGGAGTFWATYGTTTSAQIEEAYQAHKTIICVKTNQGITDYYPLVERGSETDFYFGYAYLGTIYYVMCESDTWEDGQHVIPSPQNAGAPAPLGVATRGVSSLYSRADHVHAMPSASQVGAVAVAQGSANANKFLVTDANGDVTTVTLTAWQGGSY